MSLSAAQRTTIGDWLTVAWPKIQTRQAAALAARGAYRQFRRSHLVAPQNATATAPNNLSDQPTDAPDGETLAAANLGASWPVQIEVHRYDGPNGKGYVVIARARGSTGEIWERHKNVGPEGWRDRPLAQVGV